MIDNNQMAETNDRQTTDGTDARIACADDAAPGGQSPTHDGDERLTAEQRALLKTALEEGYFEVPRQTTLVDLADEHDLPDRTVSRQLRHSLRILLVEKLEE